MARETKQESFEQLYARLEESVSKLEAGGLSLEDSIALYEEGMGLAKRCQDRLDEAEQRITKLKESFASVPKRATGADAASLPGYPRAPDEQTPDDDDPFA